MDSIPNHNQSLPSYPHEQCFIIKPPTLNTAQLSAVHFDTAVIFITPNPSRHPSRKTLSVMRRVMCEHMFCHDYSPTDLSFLLAV